MKRVPENRTSTLPGEILLEEFLEPLGTSASELTGQLGIPPAKVGRAVRGERAVDCGAVAAQLSRRFGTTEAFWPGLQDAHDRSRERGEEAKPEAEGEGKEMGETEESRKRREGMDLRFEEAEKGIRELQERRRNPTPREAVENKVLAASTREEVREAHEAIDEWLAEHPEDWYFFARGAGEQLFRIELALGRMSEEEVVRHERRVIERREEGARLLESGDRLGLLDHRGIRVPDAVRKRLEDRRNGSSS